MVVESGREARVTKPPHSGAGAIRLHEAVLTCYARHGDAQSLALAIVNSLASTTQCSRCSLLRIAGDNKAANVLAISGQTDVDTRRELPIHLADVALETFASESRVIVHAPDVQGEPASPIHPAHHKLFVQHGCLSSLSLSFPLLDNTNTPSSGDPLVLVLEGSPRHVLTKAFIRILYTSVAPTLSLLVKVLEQEKSLLQRAQGRLRRLVKLRGYRYFSLKQSLQACGVLLMIGSFVLPVPQSITAQATIVAQDSRVLIAPHTGFVKASHVRAGDTVDKNQLLASLDSADLMLQLGKWESELIKNEHAVDVALASRDRIELGQLKADAARINAELGMVKSQLDRAELRAPFDGVVISGDLSQSLGASVAHGDVLFTIASGEHQQLMLDVEEQDAGLLKADQKAYLRLAAHPENRLEATLDDVLPVALNLESGNVFRVPAVLENHPDLLRPGMEGIARIRVGSAAAFVVYTRALREKLGRLFWRVGLLD